MAISESREEGYVVLGKDYLSDRNYLDSQGIDFELTPISAVIPTRNRCPYPVGSKSNPLEWSLDTIASQKKSGLEEVIIVDDYSSDNTKDVVEAYQNDSFPFPIRYFRHNSQQGSSITKNDGLRESKTERVIFLDDDCLFSPYSVFGANYSLDRLEDCASLVHLPVYYRCESPFLVPINEIGVWDLETGVMTGNFGGYPQEYLDREQFLDEELKILSPIKITNLAGVFAIKKHDFELARGFPDFFTWNNGYREETNLAIQLAKHGKTLYMTPDPKFSSIHLKYGSRDVNDNFSSLNPELRKLVGLSNVEANSSGNRVETDEWFYNKIISTYVTFNLTNKEAGERFRINVLQDFVERNLWEVSGSRNKIYEPKKRESIYERAIKDGNNVLRVAKLRGLL